MSSTAPQNNWFNFSAYVKCCIWILWTLVVVGQLCRYMHRSTSTCQYIKRHYCLSNCWEVTSLKVGGTQRLSPTIRERFIRRYYLSVSQFVKQLKCSIISTVNKCLLLCGADFSGYLLRGSLKKLAALRRAHKDFPKARPYSFLAKRAEIRAPRCGFSVTN